MDHEQRAKVANEQDSKLAGKIVRSLKQLEDEYYLAAGPLSERMMAAAVQAIKKAVPEPFKVVEADVTASIVESGWRATRGVGQDFSLTLTEIGADEEREFCWLTAATAVGPTRLGLEFSCRPGLRDAMQAITKDEKKLADIWKSGFLLDETDARLFLPIVIPPEKLAQAFEQNTLDATMAPVAKAVEQPTEIIVPTDWAEAQLAKRALRLTSEQIDALEGNSTIKLPASLVNPLFGAPIDNSAIEWIEPIDAVHLLAPKLGGDAAAKLAIAERLRDGAIKCTCVWMSEGLDIGPITSLRPVVARGRLSPNNAIA